MACARRWRGARSGRPRGEEGLTGGLHTTAAEREKEAEPLIRDRSVDDARRFYNKTEAVRNCDR